jgi:hypothetical protein
MLPAPKVSIPPTDHIGLGTADPYLRPRFPRFELRLRHRLTMLRFSKSHQILQAKAAMVTS